MENELDAMRGTKHSTPSSSGPKMSSDQWPGVAGHTAPIGLGDAAPVAAIVPPPFEDAMLAHGTAFMLRDRLLRCSDYYVDKVCRTCVAWGSGTPCTSWKTQACA